MTDVHPAVHIIIAPKAPPPSGAPMWANAHSRADSMLGKGAKKAKGDVHYRKGTDDRNCEECTHSTFAKGETTGTCNVVAGSIEVSMVSDLFKAETAKFEKTEGEGPETEPKDNGGPPSMK